MIGRLIAAVLVLAVPTWAQAEPINLRMLSNYSRATFKTDAPLETVVGNTAGPAVTGNLTVDPLKPATASGTIKVDLTTISTGVTKRDADMQGPLYLDTASNEANKFAIFEIKSIDMAGPLEPGKEVPAKVKGILTIKQKPVETVADARVTYIRLTPEQVEAQKRFGFASENIKVRSKLGTTFSNHGMSIPQLMFLKLSNEIAIETDLTFAKQ
ncbi:MAG TPA: YceI family protein [Methylomirabilota bacterium]|jgi:polyisoprenoid-binding protein YceI|nr:YceI family protein [Methylomirabilota bacterium]